MGSGIPITPSQGSEGALRAQDPSNAGQVAKVGDTVTTPEDKKQMVVLLIMIKALLEAFITGAKGMKARSTVMDKLNTQMVEVIQKTKGNPPIIHITGNTSEIQRQQDLNKVIMQNQAVNNQKSSILQQMASSEASSASSAGQSLTQVVNAISAQFAMVKQVTIKAALMYHPPS